MVLLLTLNLLVVAMAKRLYVIYGGAIVHLIARYQIITKHRKEQSLLGKAIL